MKSINSWFHNLLSKTAKRPNLQGWPLCISLLCSVLMGTDLCAKTTIKQFELVTCSAKLCYKLATPYATSGNSNKLVAFESSELTQFSKDHKILHIWNAKEGYYDFVENKVVLREILNSRNHEVMLTLSSDEVLEF